MGMSETGEARQLGFWICLALVVGNMIGSGIFLLPANLAPYGLNAIWGWVITIGGAMCLATVFAGLAKAMPDAGGPYDYVARSMGAPPAFLVMWSYWISTWVTNAAISIAAVSYLSTLSPGFFAVPGVAPLVAIAFVALFTAIACTGAHVSGGVQIFTSVLKVMPLVAAMVIALIVLGNGDQQAQFAPTPVTPNGIAGAAALTLWAMLGFECAAIPAERVKDPARSLSAVVRQSEQPRHAGPRAGPQLDPGHAVGSRQLHQGPDRAVRLHGAVGDGRDAGPLPVCHYCRASADGARPAQPGPIVRHAGWRGLFDLDLLRRRQGSDAVGPASPDDRDSRVVRDAAQFPLVQPGAGGRSSRASGIIVLSFRAKDRRQTSLLPNGPGT